MRGPFACAREPPNSGYVHDAALGALKVTCTEEVVADIVQAITYLNERSPAAAAKLDADIARYIERRRT